MRPQPGFVPHVMTLGAGARPVLALHCTMAFGGAWSGISKAMPELTLTAPDMPSHGRSPDWDEISSFADTHFAATLDLLGDTPTDIIGHSFGAMTALRIAADHPEKVRTLTVIEPVFFAVALRDAPETLAQHDVAAKPFKDALDTGDRVGAARAFNAMWTTDAPAWESFPDRTRDAMTRAVHVVPDTYDLLYNDAAGLLKPGGLDSCGVPTLILRGALAHPAISATNKGLAARILNATEGVIKGAGHMAPISHPGAVAASVREMLENN